MPFWIKTTTTKQNKQTNKQTKTNKQTNDAECWSFGIRFVGTVAALERISVCTLSSAKHQPQGKFSNMSINFSGATMIILHNLSFA